VKTLYKNIFLFVAGAVLAALLGACTITKPPEGDSIDRVLDESIDANRSVVAATAKNKKALSALAYKNLMPEVNVPRTSIDEAISDEDDNQRFDIAVTNVPAKDFFIGLVKGTKHNITIDQQVLGTISLELKGVTVPQAMEAVRNTYGFEYEKTSYGYQVFPRRLETRIFTVNYLNIERTGQSQTAVGSGPITSNTQSVVTQYGVNSSQQAGAMPSGTIQTTANSTFWTSLKQNLLAIIGQDEKTAPSMDGRSIVVNPGSGTIVVRAYPDELRNIAQYLDNIQNIMQRQVIIEAKILEVTLNATYQSGINWNVLGFKQGIDTSGISAANAASSGVNAITPFTGSGIVNPISSTGDFQLLTSGMLNMNITAGSAFSSVVQLLGTQGKVKVLSNPRISTLNNQKAVIKVGGDRFYVTNIGSNTNSGGSSTTTSSSVTLTPFFSGISLDVTPQIDEDNYISIHVHPMISSVTTDTQNLPINNSSSSSTNQTQPVPLAKSSVRESDSIVRAKSGEVVIIGGLMDSQYTDTNSSTPGPDHLPLIGGLFKNNNNSAIRHELIILLRPIVVGSTDTWQRRLKQTAREMKSLKQAEGKFNYNIVPTKERRKR
jgi:MSHA biogenesis protein MshL